jgi:hypothetical protein
MWAGCSASVDIAALLAQGRVRYGTFRSCTANLHLAYVSKVNLAKW